MLAALRPLAATGTTILGTLGILVAPWVALAIRLWLAQAFLTLQVSMMMAGGVAAAKLEAPLAASWWFSLAVQAAHSGPGSLVQLACPLLLALGLFSRLAALAMLVEALLIPLPGAEMALRGFWVVLIGWIAIMGPGAFSLDRLLGQGAGASALPMAGRLSKAYLWTTKHLGPVYVLLLRCWLAAALVADLAAVQLPAMHTTGGMLLPHVPAMVASLSPVVMLTLAVLLSGGLATRVACLVLIALVPVGQVMTLADERLYWLLALAALFGYGAGRWSLDALFTRFVHRAEQVVDASSLPHVVVVGGGFGGVAAARALRRVQCRVTLVDQHNYTLFQPLLYQVATASLSPGDIATPIRALFRKQANVRVVLGAVTGVDVAGQQIELGETRLAYDHLVLATGAQHGYFGHEEWAPVAPGLKTIEDATSMRHRLLEAFERAEESADPVERAAWLTFIVVGGGPTGVELAGAISELACDGLAGEFRQIEPSAARVILVQSAPRLLPAFPKALSDDAARRLTAMGVDVQLDRKLEAVDDAGAVVGGERIASHTVLWAAGVMASPAATWVGAKADRAGRLVAGPDLAVPGAPNVYAIGDTAASDGWGGKPVPGLAPAAKQGGLYVAGVIAARMAGRPAPPPFRYRHYGSLATIGRKAAVADFGVMRLTGVVAWWFWGLAHIAFLIGGRSRVVVMLEWLWAYLTLKRSTRLITGTR